MAEPITVKEMTDSLYEVGYSRDKVKIHVKGKVYSTEYIDHPVSGEYEIPVEIDIITDDIEFYRKGDCVEITAWVS